MGSPKVDFKLGLLASTVRLPVMGNLSPAPTWGRKSKIFYITFTVGIISKVVFLRTEI